MKTFHSISLVGMMGVGKTCVAKKLAKKLDLEHIDTDKEIKLKTGLSVKDFIQQNMENKLKIVESEIVKNNSRNRCIISVGDYTVNNQKAWDHIMQKTLSIWININLNYLIKRLKPTENRPYFSEDLDLSNLQKLYNERKKRYSLAKIQVKSLNSTKIAELLKLIEYFMADNIVL